MVDVFEEDTLAWMHHFTTHSYTGSNH